MTYGLIKEELNIKINSVIGKCFEINRMLDRGMSLLNVKWKMVQTEKILHPMMAHAFLGDEFADYLSDYQSKRSNETIYPATPAGDRVYEKPIDLFNDILNELLFLQDILYDTYEASNEMGDYTTKRVINQVIDNLIKYVDMTQTLIDLSENYGSDGKGIALMDANIKKYFNK